MHELQRGLLSKSMDDGNVDRLSDLSGDLAVKILSLMATKDTAKTSLLSSQWRNTWRSVSALSLTLETRHVDQVINLRTAPIRKLFLNLLDPPSTDEIKNWIDQLSRHPIEHFTIHSQHSITWPMASFAIFSWENLTHLHIIHCHISPPSTFRGFENLKSLDLQIVTVDQDGLQSLISGSPALETLTLEHTTIDDKHDRLVIDAPRLKSFQFAFMDFIDLRLVNCNVLEKFDFNVMNPIVKRLGSLHRDNLIPLMEDAPLLRDLRISSAASLEYIDSGILPRELRTPLVALRVLWIAACFRCTKHSRYFYMLLSLIPNLQELHIEFLSCGNQEWEAAQWDPAFPRLSKFGVIFYRESPGETDFIERVLLASPILGVVSIRVSTNWTRRFELKKLLMQLECASPTAKMSVF